MGELLSRCNGDDLCGLLAIAGGLLCGLTAIIAAAWYRIRKVEIAASLKQDMLNRGMSADDIKTVLEAGLKS
ncbi:MAG TPA: hypothetical protein VGI75_01355 [Pirellulales bacterium]